MNFQKYLGGFLLAILLIVLFLFSHLGTLVARCEISIAQYLPVTQMSDAPDTKGCCISAQGSVFERRVGGFLGADDMIQSECEDWRKDSSSWRKCSLVSFHPGMKCSEVPSSPLTF